MQFPESEVAMVHQHTQVRLNPADETIHVGVIQIRFLVTGAESNGSAAIFELTVLAGAKLPVPPIRTNLRPIRPPPVLAIGLS